MKHLFEKYGELIRYLIVGVLTTVVSLGTYFLCVGTFLNAEVPIELQIANMISWVAAVTFAYVTNRAFVFQSKNKKIAREMFLFFTARIGSLLMDMGMMFVMVTVMGLDDGFAKIVVQVVVTVANYVLSKLFVFTKKEKNAII